MDDNAMRGLSLSIANNRTKANEVVSANAILIYDWIFPRGDFGAQCIMSANNHVLSQSGVSEVIADATATYAFGTNGDGSPVNPPPFNPLHHSDFATSSPVLGAPSSLTKYAITAAGLTVSSPNLGLALFGAA